MDEDNTPEATAYGFFAGLSGDDEERSMMGGRWLPQWANRFNREAILQDFENLDRPALRTILDEPPHDPSVRYAAIIEGAETIEGALVGDRPVVRWLTLKWEHTLQFWAVAHYGANIVQPEDLPQT